MELFFSITNFHVLQSWFYNFVRDTITEISKTSQRKISSIVSKVKKHIDENFEKEVLLEDVAKFICVSPYYLSRLFKKEIGSNFNKYLTDVRIEKAKQLLRNTNKTIKEISYETGYNSQAYFCRIFKKIQGISPSEYIKIVKTSQN